VKHRIENLSPEQIHRVLPIILVRSWLILLAIGLVIAWVIFYLFNGRVAVTAKGNGIFLTPGKVAQFQATGSGQIARWYKKVGDHVKKGELLAELDQPLIKKELEQTQQKLKESQGKTAALRKIALAFGSLEKGSLNRKRETLKRRIKVQEAQVKKSLEIAEKHNEQSRHSLSQQEENLGMLRDLHKKRLDDQKDKLERLRKLLKDQLATDDDLVQAREAFVTQQLRLSDLELQKFQLNLSKVKTEETSVSTRNRISQREDTIADLIEELEDLSNRETELERSLAEGEFAREMEVADLESLIESYEKELAENREIRSPYEGVILDLTAGEGKMVVKGQRLGSIDTKTKEDSLSAVAYFSLSDGNKIKKGMSVRLTPATVQQERLGSVRGTVREVAEYPVTEEGVVKMVGNATVAQALTKDGHHVEVIIDLDLDSVERLSRVMSAPVSAGTAATVLVDLQIRPPVSYVVPILRGE
jgi:HlyD family secretion protein